MINHSCYIYIPNIVYISCLFRCSYIATYTVFCFYNFWQFMPTSFNSIPSIGHVKLLFCSCLCVHTITYAETRNAYYSGLHKSMLLQTLLAYRTLKETIQPQLSAMQWVASLFWPTQFMSNVVKVVEHCLHSVIAGFVVMTPHTSQVFVFWAVEIHSCSRSTNTLFPFALHTMWTRNL